MRWFEGDIPTAINITKTQKSLFVVLVAEGFTEEEEAVWNDSSIGEIVDKNKCVCLNLKTGSQHANQFSQIYPVIIYPTIYFIGNNGQPLEIKVGKSSLDELKQSFMKAIELHGDNKSTKNDGQRVTDSLPPGEVVEGCVLPSSEAEKLNPEEGTEITTKSLAEENSENVVEEVAESLPLPRKEDEKSGVEKDAEITTEPLADENVETAVEEIAESLPLPSKETELSLEERTEMAVKKLAEQNAEKAAKEIEENKKKELERRKLGQEMKKLKEFKEDMERKELEKELKRKKEEDLKAREKIKREIELDREERAMKYYDGKNLQQKLENEKKIEKEAAQNKRQQAESAAKMEFARIQFKLPDGSSMNNTFSSTDLLSSAKTFILEKLGRSYNDVTLSTIHPKVTFCDGDYGKTFLELNLAPAVVLIVLPKKSPTVANRSSNVLSYLFNQFLFLYQYFVNFIFPSRDASINVQEVTPANPESSQPTPNYGGARPKVYSPQSQGLRQRREGNIHRLTADDDDDEQATWNGNSTQQM